MSMGKEPLGRDACCWGVAASAHLDQLDGLGQELPGEHIVEGLVVASRDLTESAREVLDRTQW